jgi:hypothetical protein
MNLIGLIGDSLAIWRSMNLIGLIGDDAKIP